MRDVICLRVGVTVLSRAFPVLASCSVLAPYNLFLFVFIRVLWFSWTQFSFVFVLVRLFFFFL